MIRISIVTGKNECNEIHHQVTIIVKIAKIDNIPLVKTIQCVCNHRGKVTAIKNFVSRQFNPFGGNRACESILVICVIFEVISNAAARGKDIITAGSTE